MVSIIDYTGAEALRIDSKLD